MDLSTRFLRLSIAFVSTAVAFPSVCVEAQVPRVQFPGKKETEVESPAKEATPKFRLSAGRSTEKKPTTPEKETKKPEFPPGAIQSGELSPQEQAAALPPELQPFAKEGAIAMASQDYKKARDAFVKMVTIAPNNELARANLGMAQYRLKDYQKARQNLDLAVKLNPNISKNWVTLGLVHFRQGSLELAISCLTKAIALNPRDAKAHQYLAVVAGAYGWPDAAEKELQKSLQIDPSDPDAHYNLAVLYMQKEKPLPELAWRHYNTAVELGAKPDPEMEKRIKAGQLEASQSTN